MTARHFAGVILAAVAISIAAERHRHARLLRRTRSNQFSFERRNLSDAFVYW
jgi:hypothetical protein